MKKVSLFFIFSILIIAVNINCNSSNNTDSVDVFEPFDPIESQSFAIHDSTYIFYKDFCEQLMEQQSKEELLIVNRGFIYKVEVKENELTFENEARDKYRWWIRGESKRESDYFELRYTVSSPQKKTT